MTAHDQWHLDQLVRIKTPLRPDRGGVVERLTKTLAVLCDGSRFYRKNGRLFGESGVRVTSIEPWDTRKGAEETQ